MPEPLELSPLEPQTDAGEGTAGDGPTARSEVDAGALAGRRASLLDELRTRRERLLAADPRLTLVAPNYAGRILIRYRRPEWLEAKQIGSKWAQSEHPKALLYAQAELLATCCSEIVAVDDQGAQVALDEGTVRFREAARLLGADPRDDMQAVFVLLDEVQVSAQHEDFSEWVQTASLEVDADLEGKSAAPAPTEP